MPRFLPALLGCLLLPGFSLTADSPSQAKLPPPASRQIDYTRDIQPILARSCLSCHGAEKARGGLRLDHRKSALEGGDSGAVIKSGKSGESRLIHLVAGLEADMPMPPKGKTPLTAAEIGLLRAWIDQGVKWPETNVVAGGPGRSSHWAFQPIRRSAPPAPAGSSWARNGIDLFILARLE